MENLSIRTLVHNLSNRFLAPDTDVIGAINTRDDINWYCDRIVAATPLADGWDWQEATDDYRRTIAKDNWVHWVELVEIRWPMGPANYFWEVV